MTLDITPLDWDTEFFGLKCGKVIINSESDNMENILGKFKEFDFISFQNVGNSTGINKLISNVQGAFLADVNIQFEKTADKNSKDIPLNIEIIPSQMIKSETLNQLDLEEDDFTDSKFVSDDNFKKRKGYLVYKEWLNNSVNYADKYFALYRENDKVEGYFLFRIVENQCLIELVKVNKAFQGKGIATSITDAIENFLMTKNVDMIKVGTQLNNIPAMNLYHRLGFKEIGRTSVYHLWNI